MELHPDNEDRHYHRSYQRQSLTSRGDRTYHEHARMRDPSEEKLTQYFEDLAAKALDLTKKYGLKDEFEMIKGEIK